MKKRCFFEIIQNAQPKYFLHQLSYAVIPTWASVKAPQFNNLSKQTSLAFLLPNFLVASLVTFPALENFFSFFLLLKISSLVNPLEKRQSIFLPTHELQGLN